MEEETVFSVERLVNCVTRMLSGVLARGLTAWAVPVLLLVATFKLWRSYTDSKDPSSSLPLPPGTMGLPLIGETLELIAKGSEFFRERTASYGKIYKTHILGQRTIRVTGAKNIEKILQGEGTLVTSQWPPSARLILGEGTLSMCKGETHSWRREIVMRAFSPSALRSYVPGIQAIIRDHVTDWCRRGSIHGYPEARSLTFTVAARMLLGFDTDNRQKHQMLILFEDMLATLFAMPVPLPGIGLYKGLKARRIIMKEIEQCIEQRRSQTETKQPKDALAVILDASKAGQQGLSAKEMKDSALEMLFAGHLPTSSAASSVLMYIGNNKKVYDKLSVELTDAGLLDPNVTLTYDNINSLPYVDAVVKEVLRVAPPVGAGYRKVLQTFELDGCQVPRGWSVIYSIRETHHTSKAFDNALNFDPDRWTKGPLQGHRDSGDSTVEFNHVPYGWGQRACAGQRYANMFLKIFVIELIRGASWKLENGMPEMLYMPVPHPRDNLPIQIKENPSDIRRRAFTMSW